MIEASIGVVLHTCVQCNLHDVPGSKRPNYVATILRVQLQRSFMLLCLLMLSVFIINFTGIMKWVANICLLDIILWSKLNAKIDDDN